MKKTKSINKLNAYLSLMDLLDSFGIESASLIQEDNFCYACHSYLGEYKNRNGHCNHCIDNEESIADWLYDCWKDAQLEGTLSGD